MYRSHPVIVAAALLLGACAHTDMTTFVDPAYDGRQYKSVFVVAPLQDLAVRQNLEHQICQDLADREVTCTSAIDAFPPTRKASAEQITEYINDSEIEATIVVKLIDKGSKSSYVPQQSFTTGTVGASGSVQSTTTTTGGYSVRNPTRTYRISVYDTETDNTDNIVFTATSNTQGSASATPQQLSNSLSWRLCKELAAHGLVPQWPGETP